ncbi:hypothetical protein JW978_03205 [Candidatus Dojkabacteria bacterium]|nr:hypothetical protein [Candidatus Dojkabacteria bacterium]
MKILFLAGSKNKDTELKTTKIYNSIIKYLFGVKELDVCTNIKSDFIDPIKKQSIEYEIKISDAVIVEATIPSFELGAYALKCIEKRKPILILSQIEDYKNLSDSRYFRVCKYKTLLELPNKITYFLQFAQNQSISQRLNLRISHEQREHLERMAEAKKSNISNYLRDLIEKDIISN